jgi:hypothetical protein
VSYSCSGINAFGGYSSWERARGGGNQVRTFVLECIFGEFVMLHMELVSYDRFNCDIASPTLTLGQDTPHPRGAVRLVLLVAFS